MLYEIYTNATLPRMLHITSPTHFSSFAIFSKKGNINKATYLFLKELIF